MRKLLLVAIATLFMACSSDDSSNDASSNSGLLKTLKVESDITNVTETYNYTNGNRLTSITNSLGGSETYTYTNNLLTRIDIVDTGVNDESGYITLEYDNSNQLTSSATYYTSDDSIYGDYSFRYDFTYNNDGTITREEYEGDLISQNYHVATETLTLINSNITNITSSGHEYNNTYDSKNGAWKNIYQADVLHLIGHIDSFNNNLTEEELYIGSQLDETRTLSHSYSSDNYPLQSTVNSGGFTSIVKYSYY